MTRKYHYAVKVSVTILVCVFSVPFSPRAQGAASGPVDHVRSILNQVMAIQTNPGMEGSAHREERKKAIKAIILKNFDVNRMAKDSLGDSWQKLDDKQQAEFTSIFRDLFQDSYTRLVLDFLKKEKIRYLPEEEKDGEPLVKTIILRPNENIPVDYLLEKIKGSWLVCDVSIDGVSIVGKYQSSFNRVIKSTSYDNLLEKMRIQQKAIQETS